MRLPASALSAERRARQLSGDGVIEGEEEEAEEKVSEVVDVSKTLSALEELEPALQRYLIVVQDFVLEEEKLRLGCMTGS